MAHPKYLLQEREGQRPHLYNWTPVLAKKGDMRPITEREARKYMPKRSEDDEPHDTEIDTAPEGDRLSDEEDSLILDEVNSEVIPGTGNDGPRPLEVTQEDILEKEVEYVNGLKKAPAIEEFLLKKYRVPMIVMETLEGMKEQAVSILQTLAATNSLYE